MTAAGASVTKGVLQHQLRRLVATLGHFAIAAFSGVILFGALGDASTRPFVRIAIATLGATTAIYPSAGLLTFAALAPLTTVLAVLFGVTGGFRLPENMALAVIAGWSLRRLALRRYDEAASGAVIAPAATFLLILVCSIVVGLWRLYVQEGAPEWWWHDFAAFVAEELARKTVAYRPLQQGLLLMLGVLLLLVYGAACRRLVEGAAVVRMAIAGGTAAALLNVLRPLAGALADEQPWIWLMNEAPALRINVHHTDANAAGSFFAVILLSAFAVGPHRWWRLVRWPIMVVVALALWWTGSRVAVASVLLIGLLWITLASASFTLRRVLSIAAVVMVAVAVFYFYPSGRNIGTSAALWTRTELAATAGRMLRRAPVFGIGIGEFWQQSGVFSSDALRAVYPRENAHNNFLQVAAELGVIGGAAFIWLLAAAMPARDSGRRPWARPLFFGLAAFLVTCLAGHPFLIREVAFPVWALFGTLASVRPASARPTWQFAIVATAAAVLILTLPARVNDVMRDIDLEHAASGVSRWEMSADGVRFRTAEAVARFYVRAGGRLVMPFRAERGQLRIAVRLDGVPADQLDAVDFEWRSLELVVPRASDGRTYREIELRTESPTDARVMIGEPDVR